MRTLPLEFTKGGFQYRQLARSGRAAIYEQSKCGMTAYEVVVILNRMGEEAAGTYWTYTDKRVAWAAYLGLAEKLRREAA